MWLKLKSKCFQFNNSVIKKLQQSDEPREYPTNWIILVQIYIAAPSWIIYICTALLGEYRTTGIIVQQGVCYSISLRKKRARNVVVTCSRPRFRGAFIFGFFTTNEQQRRWWWNRAVTELHRKCSNEFQEIKSYCPISRIEVVYLTLCSKVSSVESSSDLRDCACVV